MNQVSNTSPKERVCCLPGYEDFDTASISKRLPRVFYLKSIEELREEKRKKEGVIVWTDADQ